MNIDVVLQKAPRQDAIPAVLNKAFAWQHDWDFGKQGDSAVVMLHALARELHSCGAARCPGNQVIKVKKGAKLEVVSPGGTTFVYRLGREPDRKAPSELSADRIVKLRSELGPTTVALTACNPRTWHLKPYGVYKHRVVAVFTLVKTVSPTSRWSRRALAIPART